MAKAATATVELAALNSEATFANTSGSPANPFALLIVRSTFSVLRPFSEWENSLRRAIGTAREGGFSFSTLISGRAKV